MRTSKSNWKPLCRDSFHWVLQECGGYMDGGWQVSHWDWETPRIGMIFQDNGWMNSHLILGWIVRSSNGGKTHFGLCLYMNLRSIPSLTKMNHQMGHICANMKVIKAPCLMHCLLSRRSYFVLCHAKLIIWSGGSHSLLWICLDIFNIFAEMSNDQQTEIQLKLHDSTNPSGLGTTPNVGGSGLNLTAVNHAVITQKFWVLNEQRHAFPPVVWLGHNRVPHTWILNTRSNGYDNRVSDLHLLSGLAQMRVLHSLMNRHNIATMMIYQIPECRQFYTKWLTEHGDYVPSVGDDQQ